jgi:AraC-like DNA-binding protein
VGAAREYERFFGVAPRFGAKANSISLSRETMALPLVAAKAALRPSLLFLCETQLAELDGRQGLTSRARAALLEQIPRGVASRSEVARALGLSERSLNRKLQAEGATYRDVLDDVRRELALAWLADADQAVYEVAFLLGYSEPSTFHRSFRRWTGASPLAWRKRAAG